MFKHHFGVIVAAAVCAAFLAACGSSGDEELSKADFVKQAGAICKQAEMKRGQIISRLVETANPNGDVQEQQTELIQKALPTYQEAAQQIDDLGAPKGEEEKVEALVKAMEEAADKAMADPHTAVVSNIFFRKADQLAKGYELSGCII